MINRRMAENFLSDAKIILEEAGHSLDAGRFHRTIRLSQESFELSMKACLRSIGVEYPKEHEVSDALQENRAKFPGWLQSLLNEISEASIWLAEQRGPSMYGDEIRGTPAARLFTREDAERALRYAEEASTAAQRLLRELFGAA